MSESFVRPFTTNPLYSISMFIDSADVFVHNPNENDTSWNELRLTDVEFMQAFRVVCSAEFDNYLMFRNDANFCNKQIDDWINKINHEIAADSVEFEAAIHNLVFYAKQFGSTIEAAKNERNEIMRRTTRRIWRNACKIYCAMYGVEYDVIRTVENVQL